MTWAQLRYPEYIYRCCNHQLCTANWPETELPRSTSVQHNSKNVV